MVQKMTSGGNWGIKGVGPNSQLIWNFETHTAACLEVVIFYTEILSGKVVLWSFFSSETSEKSTIQFFMPKSQFRM